jgi:hypothetical protein
MKMLIQHFALLRRFSLLTCLLLLLVSFSLRCIAQSPPVVIATISDSADAKAGKILIREAYRKIGLEVEFRDFSAEYTYKDALKVYCHKSAYI